jgi:hypothetical protein
MNIAIFGQAPQVVVIAAFHSEHLVIPAEFHSISPVLIG